MDYGVQRHFQQYLSYIVVVSLIGNTLIILLLKKHLSLNSYLWFKQKCIIYHTNDNKQLRQERMIRPSSTFIQYL